jgi:hypothetical protein
MITRSSSCNGSTFHNILMQNHYEQWNLVTWLGNLNEKSIGLWSVQKALVVLNMHCSHGPFDQMWSSFEPYIVVVCWNWSFIISTFINWNKCVAFKVCFWRTSTLKSPKIIVGQMVQFFDISFGGQKCR